MHISFCFSFCFLVLSTVITDMFFVLIHNSGCRRCQSSYIVCSCY